MLMKTVKERFDSKFIPEPNSGCWLWEGAVWMQSRYGVFWIDKDFNKGRMVGAHVASLYLHRGIKPKKGEEVCHKCDVTLCVNPEHLFIGSHADNMKDMVKKGRHVCLRRKMSEQDIKKARLLRQQGIQVEEIAKVFNMSPSHMSRIVAGIKSKNFVGDKYASK